jgi:hypothetical protein
LSENDEIASHLIDGKVRTIFAHFEKYIEMIHISD